MVKLIFFMIIIISCSKSYTTLDFEEAFVINYKVTLSDTLGLSGYVPHLEQINDSILIFNDVVRAALFKHNLNNNSTVQVGRKGSGPGEYVNPQRFSVYNNSIYFIDISGFIINQIDFNGNYIASYKTKKPYRLLTHHENDFYGILSGKNNKYLIKNDDELAFSIPSLYKTKGSIMRYPIGIKLLDKKIYFMNGFEATIYSYDIDKKIETIMELPLEFKEYKIRWSDYHEKSLTQLEFHNLDESDSPFTLYTNSIINNKFYHIIEGGSNPKNWIYLINENGKIKYLIELENKIFHFNYNSNFLFLSKNSEGYISITSYKFNPKY